MNTLKIPIFVLVLKQPYCRFFVLDFFEPCRVVDVHIADHSPAPGNFPLFFHMNRGMRSIAREREGEGNQEEGMRGEVCKECCCLSKANE